MVWWYKLIIRFTILKQQRSFNHINTVFVHKWFHFSSTFLFLVLVNLPLISTKTSLGSFYVMINWIWIWIHLFYISVCISTEEMLADFMRRVLSMMQCWVHERFSFSLYDPLSYLPSEGLPESSSGWFIKPTNVSKQPITFSFICSWFLQVNLTHFPLSFLPQRKHWAYHKC